jgi:transposase
VNYICGVIITAHENLTKEDLILQNARLMAENAELKRMVEMLRFELMDLKRRIYGSKSERFTSSDQNQLNLHLDIEPIAYKEVTTQAIAAHSRQQTTLKVNNHKGRVAFPSHLRREITVLEPEGNTEGLKTIGVNVTETLEYNPGSFYVNRIERMKYAERGNQGVLMAALPERILGKSMIGNSFAAHAMVSKFVDHCPEYRLIQILRREDIHLPSSTLNDTTASVAHGLELLYSLHTERVLKSSYLEADETPNRVMTKEKKGKTHQGYYWAYRSPANKLVLFDYRPSRTGYGPRDMLKNFKGDLQTDGYSVYDEFGKHKDIT